MAQKTWLDRQADEELRRRLRADATPLSERASAAGRATRTALKWIALTALSVMALAAVWLFHQVFPEFGPATGRMLLILGGCYALASCYLISRRVDDIHAELRKLRSEISDLRTRQ